MNSEEQDSNETDNLLKFDEKPQLMKTVKFTVITKKRLLELPPIMQPQSMKNLTLSNVPLS